MLPENDNTLKIETALKSLSEMEGTEIVFVINSYLCHFYMLNQWHNNRSMHPRFKTKAMIFYIPGQSTHSDVTWKC